MPVLFLYIFILRLQGCLGLPKIKFGGWPNREEMDFLPSLPPSQPSRSPNCPCHHDSCTLKQRMQPHQACALTVRYYEYGTDRLFVKDGVISNFRTRWRHTMLPWTTLRLGWGCISSGEGPSCGFHGNSKSDAILDSWLAISVLFMNNCCKKKIIVLGRNWSQKAKLHQNCTLRWPPSCAVKTVLVNSTVLVQYGTVLYGMLL